MPFDSRHLRIRVALGMACAVAIGERDALAATSDTTTLEEIIVTAEKRTESLQNVPATVSVVSSDAINALHATQLTDIGAYVAGLQVDSAGAPGQTTLSLRGISPL